MAGIITTFLRRRQDKGAVGSMQDESMRPMERARRIRRGQDVPNQKMIETGEREGPIRKAIHREIAMKEKRLNESAFFGTRSDGKMIDGWPIK